jgi:hypothetical protein
MAHCRSWQPFHEEFAIIPFALFDCDEKMALLLERIFEGIVADGLYGFHLHSTPMCCLVFDDLSRVKVNRLGAQARVDRSLRNCHPNTSITWRCGR